MCATNFNYFSNANRSYFNPITLHTNLFYCAILNQRILYVNVGHGDMGHVKVKYI